LLLNDERFAYVQCTSIHPQSADVGRLVRGRIASLPENIGRLEFNFS